MVENILSKIENANKQKEQASNFNKWLVVIAIIILVLIGQYISNNIDTKSSLKTFQTAPTLTPSLHEVPKNILLTKSLRIGSSGDDVRILQAAFTESGLLSKSLVTGYFGNQTSNAVIQFQQAQ